MCVGCQVSGVVYRQVKTPSPTPSINRHLALEAIIRLRSGICCCSCSCWSLNVADSGPKKNPEGHMIIFGRFSLAPKSELPVNHCILCPDKYKVNFPLICLCNLGGHGRQCAFQIECAPQGGTCPIVPTLHRPICCGIMRQA